MSIDLKTIKHISKLARISVDQQRAEKLTLKLRTDEVKSKNIREQIIKNSPQDNEDYFVVPKVIE